MSTVAYVLIAFAVAVAALVFYRLRVASHETHNLFGPMLVTCPDNLETVAVQVAASKALTAAALGKTDVHLKSCSRWPEKAGCGQPCLGDLQADPETHQVRSLVAKWFEDKKCVYCGKAIAPVSVFNPPPALLQLQNDTKKTTEWDAIPAEALPGIMEEALPVCWNCHEMETFRKAYPDLVTDRPWQN